MRARELSQGDVIVHRDDSDGSKAREILCVGEQKYFYRLTTSGKEGISDFADIEAWYLFGYKTPMIHKEDTETNSEGFIVNDVCVPEAYANKQVRVIVYLKE